MYSFESQGTRVRCDTKFFIEIRGPEPTIWRPSHEFTPVTTRRKKYEATSYPNVYLYIETGDCNFGIENLRPSTGASRNECQLNYATFPHVRHRLTFPSVISGYQSI